MISAFKFFCIGVTRTFFFALALGVLLTGCRRASSDAASDRKREGFRGAVKSVRVETSKLINEAGEYTGGPREIVETHSFNAAGNLIEESFSTVEGNLLYKVAYSYGESGRKTERTILDPKGNARQRRVYTYDDRGNLDEQANYNAEGGLHSKSEYSYEGARLMESSTYNAKGALVDRWVYGYDEKGNRNVETRYFADGSVDTKQVYALDEKGNRLEVSSYNAKDELIQKEKYSYEFTSNGNWAKRTTTKATANPAGQSFEPVEVTHREIVYY